MEDRARVFLFCLWGALIHYWFVKIKVEGKGGEMGKGENVFTLKIF